MKNEVIEAIKVVKEFTSKSQFAAMREGLKDDDGQYFADKFMEIATTINGMAKTYEQSGMGDEAIAYLHYFLGSMDFYITEKDIGSDDEPGQHQAFGLADHGYGAELGYISIVELVENGVELDLNSRQRRWRKSKRSASR